MGKEAQVTKAYRDSVSAENADSLKLNVPFFTAEKGRIYANYADGRKVVVGTKANRGDKIAKSRSSRRS